MGDGIMRQIIFLSLVSFCYACIDSNCLSCDNYLVNGSIIQTCSSCSSGYVIDSSGIYCNVNKAMVIGLAVAAAIAIFLQIIILAICSNYYKKINKKRTEFNLQDVQKQQSESNNQQNIDSIKSEYKPFVTLNCCVCKKDQINAKTMCGHYFHVNCLRQKLQIDHERCPSCASKEFSPVKLICENCYAHNRIMSIYNQKTVQILKQHICMECLQKQQKQQKEKKWWNRLS